MGPLHGVKVLDLTSMVSGPMGTMILADQGADVIKIEPTQGELVRHMAPPHQGVNAVFFSCNRGKRSLAMDLKSKQGKEILLKLVAQADVFVQNFRPGTIERMGLGYDTLKSINPNIIFVSISGFGEYGPYANTRVYDPIIQALSGATDIQANRVTRQPEMFRIIIADKVTALTQAQAISSALYSREQTGEGQHIRLSMLDAMIAFFWPEGMSGLVFAEKEYDVRKRQGTMDMIYQTKDRYITAGAVSDAEWKGMCIALKREDWLQDSRFITAANRVDHASERKAMTALEIKNWDSQTLLARFQEQGVPAAALLDRTELMDHPQIQANASILRTQYEDFGEVRQAKPAAQFEQTPSKIQRPAPRIGEHSEQILSELGYDQTSIDHFSKNSIVAVYK